MFRFIPRKPVILRLIRFKQVKISCFLEFSNIETVINLEHSLLLDKFGKNTPKSILDWNPDSEIRKIKRERTVIR